METEKWITSQEVDLTNCDREAIHIPGSIQPHGVLLVLQTPLLKILQASNNTTKFFGISAEYLINQDLNILFSISQIKLLSHCIEQNNFDSFNPIKFSMEKAHEASSFSGVVHLNNGLLILELEPVLSPPKKTTVSFYHLLKTSISKIRGASSFREATESIVREVREVTGYDRVMIYRFEPDGTGIILAEDKKAKLEPYLGLHYPASDIPKQARKLYYENWLRLIVDMNYHPVEIIPAENPLTHAPLDLSFSLLRSVSPIHLEYSKNMGVAASMCISLINQKTLWGMIVCHHCSPKNVDYETRNYCEFLGRLMSVELISWEEKESEIYRRKVYLIQQKLKQIIYNKSKNFALILKENCQSLLRLVQATGAVICLGKDLTLLGSTPSKEAVCNLLSWLSNSCRQEVFFTNSLPQIYPKAKEFKETGSGLLAISIFLERTSYHLLWFRPEVIQTVNWGGDPNKPMLVENDGRVKLSPRRSFELWKETVQEKSLPWQQVEIDAAQELRNTLMLTALELSQAALQEAAERAQVANQAKTQFLARMSHELRTPLNAILGFTQIMTRDRSLAPEHLENLEIINRSGEHLLSLVNDILEMSKIETGKLTLNENSFDLYRLLDSIEEMLQLKARSKGLQLVFNRAPEVPQQAITDEGKLRQVLLNLLENAIKFTQAGSVTLQVKVVHNSQLMVNGSSFMVHGEEQPINNEKPAINHEPEARNIANASLSLSTQNLLFEVSDTGFGIAPSELDTIFEAFVQTETGRRSMQGAGLGLPISQQFARLMGGEIAVTSTVGLGSTFSVTIPVRLAQKVDAQTTSTSKKVIGLEPNQAQYRILVVEDVEENRRLMIKLLETLGFEVRSVENGKEAIAMWKDWQPHLIWMDMLMPVMDGYEATKQIKATANGQTTVIVALTAHAFNEEREAILNAGCDDFLLKPFKEEVLLDKMAHHLGVRYLYEEKAPSTEQQKQKTLKISTDADFKHYISQMPPEWVAQLYDAASLCSDDMILDLLDQIPEDKIPLARTLTDLANNFQFDKIKNLTR